MKYFFFLITANLLMVSCKEEPQSLYKQLGTIDVKLETPQVGDWLSSHKETGQTFEQYQKFNPIQPTADKHCIYIQPIGNFTFKEEPILNLTVEYIALFYNLETIKLPPISEKIIPDGNKRIKFQTLQLDAGYIINEILPKRIPENGIVIMGITAFDLYPEPTWNYVFGLADYKKRTGISSIARFSQGSSKSFDYNLCLNRIIKTSTHEIGHMFSVKHCTHFLCTMNGANGLSEDDTKPNALCSECLQKLSWNLKWDNKIRLPKLISFLKKHGFDNDAKILEAQLEIISKSPKVKSETNKSS